MTEPEKIPRLSRLTAILLKLQTRSHTSVENLAGQFQVSKRTIYRDLEALEQAGVPLAVVDGKGYALVEGYRLPPVMFSQTEANALIIAEKIIAKSTDASLIADFSSAIDKIKSVLNREEKEKSNFLSERTIIGTNWTNARSSAYLSDIQVALADRVLLKIEYRKKDDPDTTTRMVEPFAIYHNTMENWVMIAWCRLRNAFRTFRVDRIAQLQQTDETFSPHDISLDEYVEMQRKIRGENPVT